MLVNDDVRPGKFRLKEGLKLEMYVSEPPCGDSSLLLRQDEADENTAAAVMHWTGAKPLQVQAADNASTKIETGICRLKSGRSDLPEGCRSQSMSCSDKILSWNQTGVQGAFLAGIIDYPLAVARFTVSSPRSAISEENQSILRRGLTLTGRL